MQTIGTAESLKRKPWECRSLSMPTAAMLSWRSSRPLVRHPKKDVSISSLLGYPYLIGLHYKGGCMGYHYPNFCLCAFLGPYLGSLGRLGFSSLGLGL